MFCFRFFHIFLCVMIIFFISMASSKYEPVYQGKWKAIGNLKEIINQTNTFSLEHFVYHNQSLFRSVDVKMKFKSSRKLQFGNLTQYSGLVSPDNKSILLFSSNKINYSTMNQTLGGIYKALRKMNQEYFTNMKKIYRVLNSTNLNGTIVLIGFNFSYAKNKVSPFTLNSTINGTFMYNNIILNLTASYFDTWGYVYQAKIFGVLSSALLIIVYMAWNSLIQSFNSNTMLSQLSFHSFVFHIAFEFTYGMFLVNISGTVNSVSALFTFIFTIIAFMYFYIQIPLLTRVWKSNILTNDPDEIRDSLMKFFFETVIIMQFTSGAVSLAFTNPLPAFLFLYSFFIPQIIHSAQYATAKSKDTLFTILVALTRLFPLWYFTWYKMNFLGTQARYCSIIITIYVAIQVFIVLLQNHYGGSIILPGTYQPIRYDYRTDVPLENTECSICLSPFEHDDEAMITPCGHTFHSECLLRWMEEQMICPVCRNPLPQPEILNRQQHSLI